MGFLDNSGDIILDAVLTDTGRMRLAKGDGSFRIAKFALGDDEIDYGLYDKNNASGSAYYDVTILQTPVLESFTNNTSMLKSKLMSVNRNDILYLPVVQLFTTAGLGSAKHSSGTFVVPVDKTTVDNLGTLSAGVLNGYEPNSAISHIRADQGLDTNQISKEETLARDLVETQYIVEMDNRLGAIFPPPSAPSANNTGLSTDTTIPAATPSFIDDDNIASYFFTLSANNGYVSNLGGTQESSIQGPRGTTMQLRVGSSLGLRTSSFLFTEIGSLGTTAFSNTAGGGSDLAANQWRFIDSTVRITGVNTGYRIDIPVRFIKSV
jgi:hypothetical protein